MKKLTVWKEKNLAKARVYTIVHAANILGLEKTDILQLASEGNIELCINVGFSLVNHYFYFRSWIGLEKEDVKSKAIEFISLKNVSSECKISELTRFYSELTGVRSEYNAFNSMGFPMVSFLCDNCYLAMPSSIARDVYNNGTFDAAPIMHAVDDHSEGEKIYFAKLNYTNGSSPGNVRVTIDDFYVSGEQLNKAYQNIVGIEAEPIPEVGIEAEPIPEVGIEAEPIPEVGIEAEPIPQVGKDGGKNEQRGQVILSMIQEMEHTATSLPNENGRRGVKAKVRDKVISNPDHLKLYFTYSTFNKAWSYLLKQRLICYLP